MSFLEPRAAEGERVERRWGDGGRRGGGDGRGLDAEKVLGEVKGEPERMEGG